MAKFNQASTRLLGWVFLTIFAVNAALMTVLPRTEKLSAMRETLRGYHYLLGLILFLLVCAVLWRWFKHKFEQPLSSYQRWVNLQCLTLLVLTLLTALLGPLQAWADGLPVHLADWLELPPLVAENRSLWMFTGYFHSAIGFSLLLVTLAMLLTGVYGLFRYGKGLISGFPLSLGVLAYINVGISVYAMSTFQSTQPGPRAVGSYLIVTIVVMGISWLLKAKRRTPQPAKRAGLAGAVQITSLTGLLAFGGYAPHLMFRVTPWPIGEVIAAPAEITFHNAPVTMVEILPATRFETDVAMETYKWCRFCHTVDKGEGHLVGPNLYAIFGQQAATVPNFHYSSALAQAGRDGLTWTDDALDEFLADPDGFMPGTSMIISSGPITDPAIRQAVINLLKRETMQATNQE